VIPERFGGRGVEGHQHPPKKKKKKEREKKKGQTIPVKKINTVNKKNYKYGEKVSKYGKYTIF
jgi:hypothetical protein